MPETNQDIFSKEKRSEIMSRVRSRDTKPELIVRSALHKLGYRFRLHHKDLPGSPDITLPKYSTVIFVHGCFWHQHPGCRKSTIPKTNREKWKKKLNRNIERDETAKNQLEVEGWNVIVLWECELRKDLTAVMLEVDGNLQSHLKSVSQRQKSSASSPSSSIRLQ